MLLIVIKSLDAISKKEKKPKQTNFGWTYLPQLAVRLLGLIKALFEHLTVKLLLVIHLHLDWLDFVGA